MAVREGGPQVSEGPHASILLSDVGWLGERLGTPHVSRSCGGPREWSKGSTAQSTEPAGRVVPSPCARPCRQPTAVSGGSPWD